MERLIAEKIGKGCAERTVDGERAVQVPRSVSEAMAGADLRHGMIFGDSCWINPSYPEESLFSLVGRVEWWEYLKDECGSYND